MKHGHAMNPDNINWTGSEYTLAMQREEKETREAFAWLGRAIQRKQRADAKRTKHK